MFDCTIYRAKCLLLSLRAGALSENLAGGSSPPSRRLLIQSGQIQPDLEPLRRLFSLHPPHCDWLPFDQNSSRHLDFTLSPTNAGHYHVFETQPKKYLERLKHRISFSSHRTTICQSRSCQVEPATNLTYSCCFVSYPRVTTLASLHLF